MLLLLSPFQTRFRPLSLTVIRTIWNNTKYYSVICGIVEIMELFSNESCVWFKFCIHSTNVKGSAVRVVLITTMCREHRILMLPWGTGKTVLRYTQTMIHFSNWSACNSPECLYSFYIKNHERTISYLERFGGTSHSEGTNCVCRTFFFFF